MGWVLRTKNDTHNPTLPGGVYGKYITIGRGFYYRYDGSRTRFGIFISDGGRYGLDSVDSVEYKGAVMSTADWRLHRGTITKQISPVNAEAKNTDIIESVAHPFLDDDQVRFGVINGNMPGGIEKDDVVFVINANVDDFQVSATLGGSAIDITSDNTGQLIVWKADAGFDDPEQGLPEFIPEIDTTLSGIAYIEGKLTSGQSSATDPPDWDDFRIIGTGRRLMDYDGSGDELGVIDNKEFLSNLPLQVADNYLVNYSGKHSRIHWPTWRQFRDDADTFVWQRVIAINDDTPPTTASGFTGRYYADQTFTNLVLTRQDTTINFPSSSLVPGPGVPATNFSARWTATIKAKYSELTTFKFVLDDAVKFWIEGNLILDVASVGTHTVNYTLVQDQYYEIVIEFKQGVGPWALVFKWLSASLAEEVVPASNAAPSDVLVKRYENHAAFPIAIEASEVHERLMERAPGWDWTDDEGYIKFLPPDRPVVFAFDFDRMDDDNAPNFLKQTFNKKRRSLAERPNFLLFRFRDALLTGYPFNYVQADREDLRLLTNGEPTNNAAEDLGVMTRSLAERMAEMEMVLKSDPKYVALLSGLRATSKIRKNHIVTAKYIDVLDNTVVDDRFLITFHAWGASDGRNDFSLLPIPENFYTDEEFNWTPSDMSSAVARWKSSSITPVADGTALSTWEDIVGAFDATQTGTARPLYRTNNGDPYVELDGVNDFMSTSLNTAFGDFAVFMVFRPKSIAAASRILDKNFTTGFWVGVNPADATQIGAGVEEGTAPYGHYLDFEDNTWYAMFVQRTGTTKVVRLGGLSTTQTVSSSAMDTTAVTIGAIFGGGNYAHVDIKEIAIFNDNFLANDITNLETYALQEHGLVL